MSLRTPLGRVRGLGAAGEGTGHWWAQRLTAVALVPLSFVFVFLVILFKGASHADVVVTMANPLIAVILLLFIVAGFYHLKLGIQVVVEDYVHHEGVKIAILVANAFGCIVLGTACIFAVLKLAFAG